MNNKVKQYLDEKYSSLNTLDLQQESQSVKYRKDKIYNKLEYLDKKNDALCEKFETGHFVNSKVFDNKQRGMVLNRSMLPKFLSGVAIGGVIGATVVANSQGVPVEEISNTTREFFATYGAAMGGLGALGYLAVKTEKMTTLGSVIVNAFRAKINSDKLKNLETKDALIEKHLQLRKNNTKLFDNDLSLLENLSDEITDREYEQYNEENSADIKDEASDESSTDMSDDNSNDFDM